MKVMCVFLSMPSYEGDPLTVHVGMSSVPLTDCSRAALSSGGELSLQYLCVGLRGNVELGLLSGWRVGCNSVVLFVARAVDSYFFSDLYQPAGVLRAGAGRHLSLDCKHSDVIDDEEL